MAVTVKQLLDTEAIGVGDTTLFTFTSPMTVIDKITIHNASDILTGEVELHLVPQGVVWTGQVQTMVAKKVFAPYESYTFPEIVGHGIKVETDGGINPKLCSSATIGNALIIRMTGREIT